MSDVCSLQKAFSKTDTNHQKAISVSVLVPVYNERHLVGASLARLLALETPLISRLEIIAVDDCSSDGSWDVLQQLAQSEPDLKLIRHERNQGKGAAVRTALQHATGDVCIIHDADMEYDPADIPALLRPFIEEGADAVFGSRYLTASYRRTLLFRHTLINRLITALSNWFTDLDLTDVETGYKAINTLLLRSIPLRANDFRFEIELTAKLAKRRARIFEVPIRYLPRSYEEGKKIRARDGILAITTMIRYALIDDLYQADEYGSHILTDMQSANRFNQWMADSLRPHIGDRVLEIGAGIGTLTSKFIPRATYVASDINPHYLRYLRGYSIGKPYLHVAKIDAGCPADFEMFAGQFDTALMINVLEHIPDEQVALSNLYKALAPGGKAIIQVPQHPSLYGSYDRVLTHQKRYTREELAEALHAAGFRVEALFDFNRVAVPGWFVNGKLLQRTYSSRIQLKVLEILMPLIRHIDRVWPWSGLSIIGIGCKEPE